MIFTEYRGESHISWGRKNTNQNISYFKKCLFSIKKLKRKSKNQIVASSQNWVCTLIFSIYWGTKEHSNTSKEMLEQQERWTSRESEGKLEKKQTFPSSTSFYVDSYQKMWSRYWLSISDDPDLEYILTGQNDPDSDVGLPTSNDWMRNLFHRCIQLLLV